MGKNYPLDVYTYGIVYGDGMINTVLMEAGTTLDTADICGIGDVNADSTDDFCVGYKYKIDDIRYSKVILYYGNTTNV